MDTETRLLATFDQVDEIIDGLKKAARKAARRDEPGWFRITLKQSRHLGPWRLIIGVAPPCDDAEAETSL